MKRKESFGVSVANSQRGIRGNCALLFIIVIAVILTSTHCAGPLSATDCYKSSSGKFYPDGDALADILTKTCLPKADRGIGKWFFCQKATFERVTSCQKKLKTACPYDGSKPVIVAVFKKGVNSTTLESNNFRNCSEMAVVEAYACKNKRNSKLIRSDKNSIESATDAFFSNERLAFVYPSDLSAPIALFESDFTTGGSFSGPSGGFSTDCDFTVIVQKNDLFTNADAHQQSRMVTIILLLILVLGYLFSEDTLEDLTKKVHGTRTFKKARRPVVRKKTLKPVPKVGDLQKVGDAYYVVTYSQPIKESWEDWYCEIVVPTMVVVKSAVIGTSMIIRPKVVETNNPLPQAPVVPPSMGQTSEVVMIDRPHPNRGIVDLQARSPIMCEPCVATYVVRMRSKPKFTVASPDDPKAVTILSPFFKLLRVKRVSANLISMAQQLSVLFTPNDALPYLNLPTIISDNIPLMMREHLEGRASRAGFALNSIDAYRKALEAASARASGGQFAALATDTLSIRYTDQQLYNKKMDVIYPQILSSQIGVSEANALGNMVPEEFVTMQRHPSLSNVGVYALRSLATVIPEGYSTNWSLTTFPFSALNTYGLALVPPSGTMLVSGGRVDMKTQFTRRNEFTNVDTIIDVPVNQYVWGIDMTDTTWKLTSDYLAAVDFDLIEQYANMVTADMTTKAVNDFGTILSFHRQVNVKVLATKPDEDVNGVTLSNALAMATGGRYGSYTRMALAAWFQYFQHLIVEKFSTWASDHARVAGHTLATPIPQGRDMHPVLHAGPADVNAVRARYHLIQPVGDFVPIKIYGLLGMPRTQTIAGQNNDNPINIVWGAGFENAGEPVGERAFWQELYRNGVNGFLDGDAQFIDCSNISKQQIHMMIHCLETTRYRASIGQMRNRGDIYWLRKLGAGHNILPGAKRVYLHFGKTTQDTTIVANVPTITLATCIGMQRPTWDSLPQYQMNSEGWKTFIKVMSSKLNAEYAFTLAYELAVMYTFTSQLNNWIGKANSGAREWGAGVYGRDQFHQKRNSDDAEGTEHVPAFLGTCVPTIPQDRTLCEYFRPALNASRMNGPLTTLLAQGDNIIFEHARSVSHALAYSRVTANMALGLTARVWHDWTRDQRNSYKYSWASLCLERPTGIRSESLYDAFTAAACAHSYGFAPSLLTRTHLNYNDPDLTWDISEIMRLDMSPLWDWPYADLHMQNYMADIWVLPCRETRPIWPKGYNLPVPNSSQGVGFVPLADILCPMATNMWVQDGGAMVSLQHLITCEEDGAITLATLNNQGRVLAHPHPYMREERIQDVQQDYIRLPAPLGNYVNQGSLLSFIPDGPNTNTWAYSAKWVRRDDNAITMPRRDWTDLYLIANDRSYARVTLQARQQKASYLVESNFINLSYVRLRSVNSDLPLTYAEIRFDSRPASSFGSTNTADSEGVIRYPAALANVTIPGLKSLAINAMNKSIWEGGFKDILNKQDIVKGAGGIRKHDTGEAKPMNMRNERPLPAILTRQIALADAGYVRDINPFDEEHVPKLIRRPGGSESRFRVTERNPVTTYNRFDHADGTGSSSSSAANTESVQRKKQTDTATIAIIDNLTKALTKAKTQRPNLAAQQEAREARDLKALSEIEKEKVQTQDAPVVEQPSTIPIYTQEEASAINAGIALSDAMKQGTDAQANQSQRDLIASEFPTPAEAKARKTTTRSERMNVRWGENEPVIMRNQYTPNMVADSIVGDRAAAFDPQGASASDLLNRRLPPFIVRAAK